MIALTITWTTDEAERQEAAAFFARVVSQDASYISHGEIQTALSLDGKTWRPDLDARYRADLSALDATRSLAIARDGAELIGAAIVLWETENPEAPYAVLEDIAVEPAARGAGAGQAMVRFIESEAKARGAKWLFLESGLDNHGAHRFFEGAGYAPISKVFAKRLEP